jgi:hypothetical protein
LNRKGEIKKDGAVANDPVCLYFFYHHTQSQTNIAQFGIVCGNGQCHYSIHLGVEYASIIIITAGYRTIDNARTHVGYPRWIFGHIRVALVASRRSLKKRKRKYGERSFSRME